MRIRLLLTSLVVLATACSGSSTQTSSSGSSSGSAISSSGTSGTSTGTGSTGSGSSSSSSGSGSTSVGSSGSNGSSGSSGGSGGNTLQGDYAFNVVSVLALPQSFSDGGPDFSTLSIQILDGIQTCEDLKNNQGPSSFYKLVLNLGDGSQQLTAGTYPVPPAQVTYSQVTNYTLQGEDDAVDGGVTLDTVSPSVVSGHFQVGFNGDRSVSGTFSAPPCQLWP